MSFKHIWIVFKKEVKDIARDRRTLITNLLVPIILMPLLFAFLGGGMEKMEEDIENITITLTEQSNTEEIRELLENEVFADFPNVKINGIVKDPKATVQNKDARFVLEVDSNFSDLLQQGKTYNITVHYDQNDTKSVGGFSIIARAIEEYSQKQVEKRLLAMDIDLEILRPVEIVPVNAADEKRSGNFMIMMLLPMMASILIAVGGIPAATDLVAGEKERGTFEPLLTTQAGRMSILLGKYFTVTMFSFVSVIAQLIGVFIGSRISPSFFTMADAGGDVSFSMPLGALLLSILTFIALGMVFSAIQLAVSTYARSFKEAQTYLSFLIFVAMVPSYATMMMQPDDLQLYMFLVPLLNAIASLKMSLGGVVNYTYLAAGLATSLVYVVLSLMLAAWMFNRERYLFRN